MEAAVNVLIGLMLVVIVGACALGWIGWRTMKREEAEKAQALKSTGGGGGPKEPA